MGCLLFREGSGENNFESGERSMEQIVKGYRDDAALRGSFNALAIRTFAIDFEDWYQNGYWTDKYNPYSVIIDGKVVSNVSVNTTDFEIDGQKKRYIQLGTVMTDEAYRNRGLVRRFLIFYPRMRRLYKEDILCQSKSQSQMKRAAAAKPQQPSTYRPF